MSLNKAGCFYAGYVGGGGRLTIANESSLQVSDMFEKFLPKKCYSRIKETWLEKGAMYLDDVFFFFSFSIEQVKDFMSVIRILTIFNAVISYKDFPPVISYKAFKPAT